jgi:hypothetical protein
MDLERPVGGEGMEGGAGAKPVFGGEGPDIRLPGVVHGFLQEEEIICFGGGAESPPVHDLCFEEDENQHLDSKEAGF